MGNAPALSTGCPHGPKGARRSVRTRPHIHRALAHADVRTVTESVVMAMGVLGQDKAGLFATVDHADMRGLVTDWTSLHRGAGLTLGAGIADRYAHCGIVPPAPVIAATRVLHTGPILP